MKKPSLLYKRGEVERYRESPISKKPATLLGAYYGNQFSVNVHITGDCNYSCEFCAYKTLRGKHNEMPLEMFQLLLDQLDDLQKVTNATVFVKFTGGEPTIDLDKLAVYAKMIQPYKSDKVILSMTSNGWWGCDSELIKKVNAMSIDEIRLSLNEYHHSQQTMSDLVRIGKEYNGRLRAICSDTTREATANQERYAELLPYLPATEWIKVGMRHWDWDSPMPSMKPVNIPTIKDVTVEGVHIYPDGSVGTSCIGVGNQWSCRIGTIEDIVAKAPEIQKAWMRANIYFRPTDGSEYTFSPICAHLRRNGIECSCFDEKEFDVYIDDKNNFVRVDRADGGIPISELRG